MGLFDIFNRSEGGFMDVISCNEQDYLVHRWSPDNKENSSHKEHSIRYGSRLWVRPGEAAVFLYPKNQDTPMDIIKGPADQGIKTDNFPILSELVGALFGGDAPFMAEVYFFNLEQNIQLRFGIPYFDVFDARFPDLGVPCAVRGTLTFAIGDIANFIKQYRLQDFNIEELQSKVKDFYIRKAKSVVLNVLAQQQISVMQIETRLDEIADLILNQLNPELQENFGVVLRRVDLSAIELEKTNTAYMQLKSATADMQTRMASARAETEITNLTEVARIQRKDLEMGIEGKNFTVHQINLQSDVLKTAAENLGQMGSMDSGNENGGFNTAGLMTGMALGGTMANQMGGMMGNIQNTPPPPPVIAYHIALNGQQSGPFTVEQLKGFVTTGQFTPRHYLWKQGMAGWELAESIPEFSAIFGQVPPPPPPPAG
nr:SPFH domain-containing protein [uncultured Flavobacterium sp.]